MLLGSKDDFFGKYLIVNSNVDSILLENTSFKGFKICYKKIEELYYSEQDFDSVEINFLGCYGDCPVDKISINSNGCATYINDKHTKFPGVYSIQINQFNLFEYFKYIDFERLKEAYTGVDDDWGVEMVIFKRGQIIKKVQFSQNCAPYPLFNKIMVLRNDILSRMSLN